MGRPAFDEAGFFLFGVEYAANSYRNSDVRDLRNDEWSGGRSEGQNGIRFGY